MTEDEWAETYKPIQNHLNCRHGYCVRGVSVLFETYGQELGFVREVARVHPECVWTYMDDDNGNPCIGSGYSVVNRIGYFITEIPALGIPEEDFIQDVIDY